MRRCAAWGNFQAGEHMCVPVWSLRPHPSISPNFSFRCLLSYCRQNRTFQSEGISNPCLGRYFLRHKVLLFSFPLKFSGFYTGPYRKATTGMCNRKKPVKPASSPLG